MVYATPSSSHQAAMLQHIVGVQVSADACTAAEESDAGPELIEAAGLLQIKIKTGE